MNYLGIYNALIAKRINDPVSPGAYSERHHIIPKSLGGSNRKSNLVRLTAREHFVAHWLLAKIHGGPMWTAFKYMCDTRDVHHTARTYEIARINYAERLSQRVYTPELRRNISEAAKRKVWSEEHKRAISEGQRARWARPGQREAASVTNTGIKKPKLSVLRRGMKLSEETKRKISLNNKMREDAVQIKSSISHTKWVHVGIHCETNERVELRGNREMRAAGFSQGGLLRALIAGKPYRGYTWSRIPFTQ